MAAASLLALLDDIATVLDDVALMTRTAAKKTAGIVGDDLAVNAEQRTGTRAARELPVVRAVAKGSFVNKLILVPAALVLAAFAPWAILPLMVVGTLAMFTVGGGILTHAWPALHHATEAMTGGLPGAAAGDVGPFADLVVGAIAGVVVLTVFALIARLRGGRCGSVPEQG